MGGYELIPEALGAISGLVSSIGAGKRRREAERQLENMPSPTYQPNQSILDYYQKALDKYNVSPTETAEYKQQAQNVGQNAAQAISALNDRRMSGSLVPNIMMGANTSMMSALTAGEKRKAQDLARLGSAAQMKGAELEKAYRFNQLSPFERKYNLLAAKAAGQAQVQNQAMQNIYGNLFAMANSLYKDNKNKDLFKNLFGNIFNAKRNKNVLGGYGQSDDNYGGGIISDNTANEDYSGLGNIFNSYRKI